MPARLSEETIKERIANLASRGITVLGREYRGVNLFFTMRCQCGHQWTSTAALLKNHGCRGCYDKRAGVFHRYSEADIEQIRADLAKRSISVTNTEYRHGNLYFSMACRCGHIWENRAVVMKRGKAGSSCPRCAYRKRGNGHRSFQYKLPTLVASLAERGITVLGSKYKKGRLLYLSVRCECGHEWSTRATGLRNGTGCPKCADHGFDPGKPAIVYYVKFGDLYKIGVSNYSVTKRFLGEKQKPEIVEIWQHASGAEAYEFEQKVIRENAFDLYHGPPILKYTGNDEFFVRDVLMLDGAQRAQQQLPLAA